MPASPSNSRTSKVFGSNRRSAISPMPRVEMSVHHAGTACGELAKARRQVPSHPSCTEWRRVDLRKIGGVVAVTKSTDEPDGDGYERVGEDGELEGYRRPPKARQTGQVDIQCPHCWEQSIIDVSNLNLFVVCPNESCTQAYVAQRQRKQRPAPGWRERFMQKYAASHPGMISRGSEMRTYITREIVRK